MKDNRKNRALNFVREKNNIRTGGLLNGHFKVSTLFDKDIDNLENLIKGEISFFCSSTNRKYRSSFDFEVVNIEEGYNSRDLLQDIFTVRFFLKVKY